MLFYLHFMQARVDWVLRIFGTQVTRKKRLVRPAFPDYLSVSYDYGRSSRPDVLCKKGVLRNFAKFTGKHLCQSLYFNKVAGPRHKCFLVDFAKFLRTPFLTDHLRWLLLLLILYIQMPGKSN